MNPLLKQKIEAYEAKNALLTELAVKLNTGTASEPEIGQINTLGTELDALNAEIEQINSAVEATKRAAAHANYTGQAGTIPHDGTVAADGYGKKFAMPASARSKRVKNFKKTDDSPYTPAEKAFRFGKFIMASLGRQETAQKWCNDHGIQIKAQLEGNNTVGGYLVPEEFENDLIDLREQFGTFRNWAKVRPMKSETRSDPRRVGGVTAYPAGETDAIQESMKNWDRVNLVAKKVMTLVKFSTELDEDAVIDIGDDLAKEIAYAFAVLEDQCGYNGDGTSAFCGIMGVRKKFLLSGTQGLIVAPSAATSWTALQLGDFSALVGALPQYADTPNAAWFCHRTFFYTVMVPTMLRAGGTQAKEVAEGRRNEYEFLGYPVRISQAMPATSIAQDIPVFFGDLALAATFGDRRQTTIAMSSDFLFANDEIAMRGTERFDINVHDIGNANTYGPLVALQLHA